jgi:hypothetical protein
MSNQNFSDGQEIVFEDLNSLQTRNQRFLLDHVIFQLLQKNTDGFFNDSMSVIFQNATQVLIRSGLGYMLDSTDTKNPDKKPMILRSSQTLTIDTPDNANPRIDIVAVKWAFLDDESESRNVKDELTEVIAAESVVVSKKWSADVQLVAGTPAGSPSAPAVPAGYIKVAEILVSASTGIADQNAITDTRKLLPILASASPTGSAEYDAVVGDTNQAGVNYGDLKSALDNASDGWKILVIQDESIDTVPVVNNNNIEIVFKRGVTLSKGTSTKGLSIAGEDCRVINARLSGFSTVSDVGIEVLGTAKRCYLDAPRFLNCDTNINDLGPETFVNVEYQE